jgi:hypothetical protein
MAAWQQSGSIALSDHRKIDATELISARLSPDRTRLLLTLRDQDGKSASLSLPTDCLNAVLTALPRQIEAGTVQPLDTWTMNTAENGQDLVLTLRTPDGRAVSFVTKPWQVEGMATIATYGRSSATTPKSIH